MPTRPTEVDTLRLLSHDALTRPLRVRKLQVVDYKPHSRRPEEQLALPGTITVLMARHGNKLFADIAGAVKAGSGREGELAKQVYRQYKDRKTVPLDEAVKVAREQPSFADLRYGGGTLVQNLFVPEGLDVVLVVLPYNGGRLAPEGFSLAEHPRSDKEPALDVLVLRHVPDLSKAEAAAIDRVPPEQLAINVGHGPGEVACSVLLLTVAVVAEVAIVAVTYAITGAVDLSHVAQLDAATIERLGPAATAGRLVELRRAALRGERA